MSVAITIWRTNCCRASGTSATDTAITSTVFDRTHASRVFVPSFATTWGFVAGGLADSPDVTGMAADEIDRRIAARLTSELAYYDGTAHRGLFALPKYVRQALAGETRVITDAEPLFAV